MNAFVFSLGTPEYDYGDNEELNETGRYRCPIYFGNSQVAYGPRSYSDERAREEAEELLIDVITKLFPSG